ncbi:MAG: hypothetical protein K6F65_05550 [Lachnospiraceae bacterium]|nr:hypothetical protein [Lachnospiraceae bacterium]
MKNRLFKKLMILGAAFSLALSACSSQNVTNSGDDTDIEEDDDDDDRDHDEPDEEPPVSAPEEIDYSSSKSILKFVKGTWDLTDRNTGEVYGELEIERDGSVKFTYLETDVTVEGDIVFQEPFGNKLEGISAYCITLTGLEAAFDCWTDEDASSGLFRLAQSEGKDYLYLEELGNGGSNIGYEVFRSPGSDDYNWEMNWVFTRDNDVNYISDDVTDDVFYAFAYETNSGSICLQRVDDVAFESFKEYTNYRYMAAYFDDRKHPEAVWYPLSSGADLNGILSEKRLSSDYPLTVYEVTISDGEITKMIQADRSEYGVYELYSLEQDVNCDGEKFTINDCNFYLSDYGVENSEILDYEVFGDYLIMRTHQNPHANTYVLFNMRTAWPEKKISGCNFLHDEHVWDSYYSYMDTVYNYEGYPVASVDGYEITGLSFTGVNNNQLVISYWKDEKCTETVEETIDRPFSFNGAIYAFADYRHHACVDTWTEFMSHAPQGARMMIMINPPSDDSWDFYQPEMVDGVSGLDFVYVVALHDNTFINLGNGEGPVLDKGQIHCYSLTVPEAGSSIMIHAETADGESIWPVSMISGKEDIRFAFE